MFGTLICVLDVLSVYNNIKSDRGYGWIASFIISILILLVFAVFIDSALKIYVSRVNFLMAD